MDGHQITAPPHCPMNVMTKPNQVMKRSDILDQIIGVLVMGQDGVKYRVTGWKQVHEMFEPYIELTAVGDYIDLPIYVTLRAYADMCDIADNAHLPVV